MITFVRKIHRWIGLIIGVFLIILCFTGAMIALGKVLQSYAPFFKSMVRLHRHLFLGETGSLMVGIVTLLTFIEIVTGYWLWGHTARAMVRGAKAKGTSAWRAFCHSLSWTRPTAIRGLHVAGGFWIGIPLALMVLTGLTWSFGWYTDLVNALFAAFSDDPSKAGMFHTIVPLHTGSWGGVPSRILWIIVALLGITTSITGFIIYLHHRHRHDPKQK